MSTHRLRLGTRASALARWQAGWVAEQLQRHGIEIELVPISTRGDIQTSDPIGNLGSPGVFTKELQRALLDERIDLAVHSLKDLPTEVIAGLSLAAVPKRESPCDVLISRRGETFDDLPRGATIGTGSLRRRAQLLHARPDLQMQPIRGNVDTRLQKLADGQFDALVLAEAGLKRLGLAAVITEVLPAERMLPAVGQGALGIECRADDATTGAALALLDDETTHAAVRAERALLAALTGGCLAPIAAWARADDARQLTIDAAVLAADGSRRIVGVDRGAAADAVTMGQRLAARLLAEGAGALIAAARVGE